MSIRFSDAGLRALGYPPPHIQYNMPDLSDLFPRNMANVSLDRLTGNFRGPKSHPHFNMWMNAVRLTDLAITDYEAARGHLATYREHAREGQIGPFYQAINDLESCVGATFRSVLNCERLQVMETRKLNGPTTRQREMLRLARNHIQHMDDKLEKGQVGPRDIHLLAPLATGLAIGKVRLPYRDLASCITKLYRNIEIIRRAPSK